MRLVKAALVMFTLVLLIGLLASPVSADQWNKKTVITFSQPVEIPGGKVLPAGTYTFKLLDATSYRHIVQIWNEDGTNLITTVLAIPNYRLEPTGETVLKFKERAGNAPEALKAWFYPGDGFGQEFVYPKQRAVQLAEATKEVVPAEEVEPTPSTLETVPLVAVTPEDKEEPLTEAFQVLPHHAPEQALPAKELPKTASNVPLFGLLGLAFIGAAVALKLLVKQPS